MRSTLTLLSTIIAAAAVVTSAETNCNPTYFIPSSGQCFTDCNIQAGSKFLEHGFTMDPKSPYFLDSLKLMCTRGTPEYTAFMSQSGMCMAGCKEDPGRFIDEYASACGWYKKHQNDPCASASDTVQDTASSASETATDVTTESTVPTTDDDTTASATSTDDVASATAVPNTDDTASASADSTSTEDVASTSTATTSSAAESTTMTEEGSNNESNLSTEANAGNQLQLGGYMFALAAGAALMVL